MTLIWSQNNCQNDHQKVVRSITSSCFASLKSLFLFCSSTTKDWLQGLRTIPKRLNIWGCPRFLGQTDRKKWTSPTSNWSPVVLNDFRTSTEVVNDFRTSTGFQDDPKRYYKGSGMTRTWRKLFFFILLVFLTTKSALRILLSDLQWLWRPINVRNHQPTWGSINLLQGLSTISKGP